MRYEIIFCVPQKLSGEATYMAKKLHTSCIPYQFERPYNFYAQQFIFPDIESLNQFLKSAKEKFGGKFIVESIENITYKYNVKKDGV